MQQYNTNQPTHHSSADNSNFNHQYSYYDDHHLRQHPQQPLNLDSIHLLDSYLASFIPNLLLSTSNDATGRGTIVGATDTAGTDTGDDKRNGYNDKNRNQNHILMQQSQQQQQQQQQHNYEMKKNILQICNYLFCNNNLNNNSNNNHNNNVNQNYSLLLESAIEVLESMAIRVPSILSSSSSLIPSPQSSVAQQIIVPAVRLIQSSSNPNKCMIIVRSYSNNNSYSSSCNTHSNSNNENQSHNEYMITIGSNHAMIHHHEKEEENDDNDDTTTSTTPTKAWNDIYNKLIIGKIGYHCTCRSFYERLKRSYNNNSYSNMKMTTNNNNTTYYDSCQQRSFVICKHLLAARLAPFLHCYTCFPTTITHDHTSDSHDCIHNNDHISSSTTTTGNSNRNHSEEENNDDHSCNSNRYTSTSSSISCHKRRKYSMTQNQKNILLHSTNQQHQNSNCSCISCYQEETVNDEEFTNIYTKLSMGLWY